MAGDLVYFTIGVPDSDRGRAFFESVFGWQFAPGNIEGGFHITGINPVGGMHEGGSAPGFRPYFHVEDIASAVQRVAAAGGTAGEVKGSPESGQYSDCADDQGTEFSLFQPPSAAAPQ
jgi:predicted enzyme related to lactoylglutathione lyase